MEVMSEVKVFQVKMKCDKCKEGYIGTRRYHFDISSSVILSYM